MTVSSKQKRALARLAPVVDRVSQTDRRFFERRPDRKHRVRVASRAEIEQFGILAGFTDLRPPIGFQHYVVVKNLSPGIRLRRPLTSPANNDVDVSEAEAAWLYETLTDYAAKTETQLRSNAETQK